MAAAAKPAERPRYEILVDKYFASQLKGKSNLPAEQMSQVALNATTYVRIQLGMFSQEWKEAEGPAYIYAFKKYSEHHKEPPKNSLLNSGMNISQILNAGLAGMKDLAEGKSPAAALPQIIISCAKCKKVMQEHNRCTRCMQVDYCNPECQSGHWKAHKKFCKLNAVATAKK